MDTLDKIVKKYNIDLNQKSPIEIPNMGRVQMAQLFGELGFKFGVEIGVRGGEYSLVLMESVPGLVLAGVDPYTPQPGYRDITRKESFNAYEQAAHEKLHKFGFNYGFIKLTSKEALDVFKDGELDFVYIDGDHCFEEATFDIAHWSKKVKKGGIVSGDDYFKHKGPARIHVYYAINGYTESWGIKPWFIVGSKAIVEGEIRDHGRSWFFVKK